MKIRNRRITDKHQRPLPPKMTRNQLLRVWTVDKRYCSRALKFAAAFYFFILVKLKRPSSCERQRGTTDVSALTSSPLFRESPLNGRRRLRFYFQFNSVSIVFRGRSSQFSSVVAREVRPFALVLGHSVACRATAVVAT